MILIQNISKSYGRFKALDDISFKVEEGELFGLLGPDGAGKTTLFRILTTLLLPEKGQVWMRGMNVVEQYRPIRSILGYMPGKFSLYPDLSVEENLRFFASIFNVSFDENSELIKDIYVQLHPFRQRQAGKLSGGMKQKLALCCALIHKPQILVLDEPTTGVDAVSRVEFWEMLAALKMEGITIIVSTPYMDEAILCDRVALIQNGGILKVDTPRAIEDSFKRKILSVKADNTYSLIKYLKQHPGTHAIYPFGQVLHYIPRQEDTDERALYDHLSSMGFKEIEIKKIRPDIEDCFMELMNDAAKQ